MGTHEDFAPTATAPGTTARLMSIDALRGFDMFWLIGGGAVFTALADVWPCPFTQAVRGQLAHVAWDGLHFEDCIYPLFLFIIGAVLPFSLLAHQAQGQDVWRLHGRILKRSLLLVLLASIPRGVLRLEHWPAMGGVLEHIAICYFFAALLVLHTRWQTRLAIVLGFLVLYGLALVWVPVPGYGAGVFTEEGNLGTYLDKHIISGRPWNEGPTSTPSGICLILCGSLAGQWLQSSRSGNRKALGLAWVGAAAVLLGWATTFWVPIVKRILWTSPYVVITCGFSLLLLAAFYWVIDVRGHKRWALFFVVIGMNAITIYFLQQIVDFPRIANMLFGGIVGHSGPVQPLVRPVADLAVKWLFLWVLYRHKVFLRV